MPIFLTISSIVLVSPTRDRLDEPQSICRAFSMRFADEILNFYFSLPKAPCTVRKKDQTCKRDIIEQL